MQHVKNQGVAFSFFLFYVLIETETRLSLNGHGFFATKAKYSYFSIDFRVKIFL